MSSARNDPPSLVTRLGGLGLPRQRSGSPRPRVLQTKVDRELEAKIKSSAGLARVTVSQWLYECTQQALTREALAPRPDAAGVTKLRLRSSESASVTLRLSEASSAADAEALLELSSGSTVLHLRLGATDLRRLAAALERQALELEQHTESST